MKNAFNQAATESTVGASFVTKRVLDTTSDSIVRLQIWDTAGQERFRSISRLYYRGADAGLLCYDITDEQSFVEMTGWLLELKQNTSEDEPIVIHVVGTKSDIVADDPSKCTVPFERTIGYVAEQLYPSLVSPPPSSGKGSNASPPNIPDSKRSSGFWGQDIAWDCCHEISSKDGEGIEEVFRVITRKLVERRNKRLEADARRKLSLAQGPWTDPTSNGGDSLRTNSNLGNRRSWLGLQPVYRNSDETVDLTVDDSHERKCC